MYGWAGKVLHVDLTENRIWKEPFPEELGARFLGGRGSNARLLWRLIKRGKIDPLGPENVLIFGNGPLTGTSAPTSGRSTITCLSPETNLYLKSGMGGHWGAELKFAGFDNMVIYGKSSEPLYLWISNGQVELRDASKLWGLSVKATDQAVKKELGDEKIRVACIGPAGENLVRIAGVMCSVYHSAARGGLGAVMGAKKLKAIAVRGTGTIQVKDPEGFNKAAKRARKDLAKDSSFAGKHMYGTSGGLVFTNQLHRLSAYNYTVGHLDDPYPITGQKLVEKGFLKRRVGCSGCTISCHRYSTVDEGEFAGSKSGGPEYETFAMLGACTGVMDTEAVLKANELCNDLGLDTISTGSVIAWAMETYEKGLLSNADTEGLDLRFGNSEALVETVRMIGYRKGIGNLLAEGVKRAAEKVGKDSWKWAMCNSKGMEQSGVQTRAAKSYALAFAVNPRGPDHLHTECLAERGGRRRQWL